MTTVDVLKAAMAGPSEWNNAHAPKDGPYFVRAKDDLGWTIHDGNWLLREIHGPEYQWAWPKK